MSFLTRLSASFLALAAGTCLAAEADLSKLRDVVECTPRAGLPNFFAKCERGGTVKVAYIGGSITCQSGWRVQSLDLLRKLYPKVNFEEIYAPIGGTTSRLGVYRLEHDVTDFKPDLLFVEFGINDSTMPLRYVGPCMEGIVRNTWTTIPDCDICFAYTINGGSFPLLKEGKLSPTVAVHEEVADRYGVPTIHMGLDVAKLDKQGKLAWKEEKATLEQVAGKELDISSGVKANPDGKIPYSKDGVHPYTDTGHVLYTAAIERSLPKIKESSGKPVAHTELPSPLNADYVKKVSFLDVGAASREGAWTKIENPGKTFGCGDMNKFLPSVWRATPGSTLALEFKGKSLMLYTISGPDSGAIEITIDGKANKSVLFDPYSSGWRLNPCFPSEKLDPEKTHKLTIKVLADEVDKRKILGPEKAKAMDAKPELFKTTDLLIGGICIEDGKITGK